MVLSREWNPVGQFHGYHRDCYQRFTRNVDRLKEPITGTSTGSRDKQRRESCDSIVLFSENRIFCNKEGAIGVKRSGSWTAEGKQLFQSDACKTIFESAERETDEKLLRIRGYDLFASEAHFHLSCRK